MARKKRAKTRSPHRRSANEPAVLRQAAARIRTARIARGVTQEEAADRARIDYKRYQALEAGRVNATIGTLLRVAEALDMTIWAMLATVPAKSRS